MLNNEKIQQWQQANLFRVRKLVNASETVYKEIDQKKYLSFSSNDYLGLAHHPEVKNAAQQALQRYGMGSTASKLVCGYTEAHQELEHTAAKLLQRDRAILFGNGYMANVGVLTTLTTNKDHIYQDRHNHASLLDGGQFSKAESWRYSHKQPAKLEKYLARSNAGNSFIVSDSVFSVNGDIVNLPELIQLSQQYHATLMIDDAHGFGVLGNIKGAGISEYYSATQEQVPILICPLGKAVGCYGAIVAGSTEMIEQLIQFCRSYIYTTAIPPAVAAAANTALHIIQNDTARRERLHSNIAYFTQSAKQRNLFFYPSQTAIQTFPIGNPLLCQQLSEKLMLRGFLISCLRPPTTPKNAAVLRITLSSEHTTQHIDTLMDALIDEQPTSLS